jgi:hypothetical protein
MADDERRAEIEDRPPWAYVPPLTAAEKTLVELRAQESQRVAWVAAVQSELRRLRVENTALRTMLDVRGVTPAAIAEVIAAHEADENG